MTKWTREQILRLILAREAAGEPLTTGGKNGIESTMYQAASRMFGSWRNALLAAGIPADRANPRERWTPSRILAAIRELSRRRRPIGVGQIERTHGSLVAAARRVFGSWPKAVIAAGIDPQRFKRIAPWTRERVIEAILTRALNNEPLGSTTVHPPSLAGAGIRMFGRWRLAIAAAGLDPDRYLSKRRPACRVSRIPAGVKLRPRRPGQRWTAEEVVQAILQRLREQRPMNANAVYDDNRSLYRAAESRFGNWRKALQAAGLNPDEFRGRSGRPGGR